MRRLIALALIVAVMGTITVVGTARGSQLAAQTNTETSDVLVEPEPHSSVAAGLVDRAKGTWPWYLTRTSGLVAAGALILLMLSGVGLITGHTFSFFEPLTAWASHRALGITFGLAVLLHLVGLYFDHFVPFDFQSLLIPFVSDYKSVVLFGTSVGSLYVALGILSLYIVAAIILTSLVWLEKTPKLWKFIHLLSYLVMIFIFIHALYLGTDIAGGWLRWLWIGFGVIMFYAFMARLWRAETV